MRTLLSHSIPLLALTASSHAWGSGGHRITAQIASYHLSHGAVAMLKEVFGRAGEDFHVNTSLPDIANWADTVTRNMTWSRPLHFINVEDCTEEDESCHFNYDRDCKEDECVVAAIANYTNRLSDEGSYDDLRFLVHFVGDIHQPLHCARADDLGGNTIKNVTYESVEGDKFGLHQIWDFAIIENYVEDFGGEDAFAESLNKMIADGSFVEDVDSWTDCSSSDIHCVSKFGQESVDLALEVAYPEVDGHQIHNNDILTTDYEERAIQVIYLRLAQGGMRLAKALNDIANQQQYNIFM